ncbi:MotA/TolQ/ExbB proton channel family protein [candidate division WOR-3 bacterium]|nr:MotA/TolQ/ExbB proton channel family protein [candidate division WOR-3 bacterium]
MSLFVILSKGGYTIIAIAIAAFIGLYVVIERFLYYRRIRENTDELIRNIKPYLDDGDFTTAINILRQKNSPQAKVIVRGLLNRSRESMEAQAREEVKSLEKGIGVLSSVVAVSPMLGFFGTVVGMIRAFMQIESLGGSVNPSRLAGGIWEALVTTAAGLGVAIVFLILYNILVDRENTVVQEINRVMDEFSPYLGG